MKRSHVNQFVSDVAKAHGKVLAPLRSDVASQKDFAKDNDLDRTFISQMERGIRQPTLTTVFKLAHGLSMTPAQLVRLVEIELKAQGKL